MLTWHARADLCLTEAYLLDCLEKLRANLNSSVGVFTYPQTRGLLNLGAGPFGGSHVDEQFRRLRLLVECASRHRAVAYLRLAEFVDGPLSEGHPALTAAAPNDSWVEVAFVNGRCTVQLSFKKVEQYAGKTTWASEEEFHKDYPAIVLEPRQP